MAGAIKWTVLRAVLSLQKDCLETLYRRQPELDGAQAHIPNAGGLAGRTPACLADQTQLD